MKQYRAKELRSKISFWANERIKTFRKTRLGYKIKLKDGYIFEDTNTPDREIRSVKELMEVTRRFIIVEVEDVAEKYNKVILSHIYISDDWMKLILKNGYYFQHTQTNEIYFYNKMQAKNYIYNCFSKGVTDILKSEDFPKSFNLSMMKKEVFTDNEKMYICNYNYIYIGYLVEFIIIKEKLWKDDRVKKFLDIGDYKTTAEMEDLSRGTSEYTQNLTKALEMIELKNVKRIYGWSFLYDLEIHLSCSEERKNLSIKPAHNIRVMSDRALNYFNGVKIKSKVLLKYRNKYGFMIQGQLDFVSENAIYDLKCYRGCLTSVQARQVLFYYILAKKIGWPWADQIEKIVLYNPYKNESYTAYIKDIDKDIIQEIEYFIDNIKFNSDIIEVTQKKERTAHDKERANGKN